MARYSWQDAVDRARSDAKPRFRFRIGQTVIFQGKACTVIGMEDDERRGVVYYVRVIANGDELWAYENQLRSV